MVYEADRASYSGRKLLKPFSHVKTHMPTHLISICLMLYNLLDGEITRGAVPWSKLV